jgi:hypothetical protein
MPNRAGDGDVSCEKLNQDLEATARGLPIIGSPAPRAV